jgi:hypothetical protein
MTWEHVRFLALLIPTWLVLGAAAVSLSVPSNSRAGHPDEHIVQANLSPCRDSGGAAAQLRHGEQASAVESYGVGSPATSLQ